MAQSSPSGEVDSLKEDARLWRMALHNLIGPAPSVVLRACRRTIVTTVWLSTEGESQKRVRFAINC